jgi:DNA-binding Lrp family transcriptional regulator
MESVTIGELDRTLIQALQIDGRAPFNRIAAVLGVSDQTVARRYRALRSAGIVRVVAQTDPARLGHERWLLRVRCTPDASLAVANALARRADTNWVHLMSGGTEITCVTQVSDPDERDALLLQKLPRTPRVIDVSAHSQLHIYFGGSAQFPVTVDSLTPDQIRTLTPPAPAAASTGEPPRLDEKDRVLINTLMMDGRTGYPALAAATGWSESTTRRRLEHLHDTGALFFDVDTDPRALGFAVQARLWMSVPPSELAAVGHALAGHPETAFAAATTGPTNLTASVVCRDARAFYTYLTERLGALRAVTRIESAPVIRTIKSAGMVLPRA